MLFESLTIVQFILIVAVSAFVSLVCCWLGVWGIEKLQNRRLTDVELDIEALRAKLNSFVKTVSGRIGQEKKKEMGSIEDQAKLRLAHPGGGGADDEWLAGGKG